MSDYRSGYSSLTAAIGGQLNNTIYCAETFPSRMYNRMRRLETIKEDGELTIDSPTPAWVTSNNFAKRLTGLTDRGEFYLNILKTAFDRKMRRNGWAGMYFASSKEEQRNKKDTNSYMRPLYDDVILLEDATDSKYGVWLNPVGRYFTGKWVKYDEKGYHRL